MTPNMPRPNPLVLLAVVALLVSAWPAPCAASPPPRHDNVLVPVTKDPATSLYTIPVRLDENLVVDLAGPLVWSTCSPGHMAAFKCDDPTCKLAGAYRQPGCTGKSCTGKQDCTAFPYNPITGKCAAGKVVHTRFIANTTDGKNPLSMVSVKAVAACAPEDLLKALPKGATGVAGLASSGLALPAQVASSQRVADKFLLCLPRSGYGPGAAIFGGGSYFVFPPELPDVASTLAYVKLLPKKDNPGYFVSINGVAMNDAAVHFPRGALANGGAELSTRAPYTMLRSDVYRPFVNAFLKAMDVQQIGSDARVRAVAPFEVCYNSTRLGNGLTGYFVPAVTLTLDGGKNWTLTGSNSMVDVKSRPQTACLAFVEMKAPGYGGAPAVVIGGFQMENYLLQFDLKKKELGFAKVTFYTSCSNFNFTRAG